MLRTAAVPLLFLLATAGLRGQSALDGFDPNANGRIWAVVVQSDGKILIGGDFTTVSPNGGAAVARNRIARLNADGTLDPVFNPNANDSVYAIAVQPDGKILAGGFFNGKNSIGGQTRNYIARLDPTTGLADSFDPNANDGLRSIIVQADGKILVGGVFTAIGGQVRHSIARLDASTGSADAFDPDADSAVISIAVQPDGKILAGGFFLLIGGQTRDYIARLDPTTGRADSFNPHPSSEVVSIAIQADGKILAGGNFVSVVGQPRHRIVRFDATTGLPDSFNPNANHNVWSIAVQADGKILVGGDFTSIGGQPRGGLARLDALTGLPDSFNPNANLIVWSLAVQPDGKILAAGDFTTLAPNGGAPVTRNHIARVGVDGSVDQTLDFGIETDATFDAIFAYAIQPDGKILVGGRFESVRGVTRHHIARFYSDGTLDPDFDPEPDDYVSSIAVQADGKILVGGEFGEIGGQSRSLIARLDPTTGSADSFNPNGIGGGSVSFPNVGSISVQADGKILVGGAFTNMGGQPRNHIARLDGTTGLADSFSPNADSSGFFPSVTSIAVQPDGQILVGGAFETIGGQSRNYLARLDATTGLADSFNPNPNEVVFPIAVQADGHILVSGYFQSIGGQPRDYMARLDPVTGLADSFSPHPSIPASQFAVQADGKILTSGQFTSIGGQNRNRIARLDATTGLADSFDPDADDSVYSMALLPDGKVLVGGFFENIDGQPRNRAARLNNDIAALQDLIVTQATITWTRGGSSPSLTGVSFEFSTDSVNYTYLGSGILTGGHWILTGLNLPTGENIYIRASGFYHTGGSESITESVRNAFLLEPNTFANISTRLRVETGENVLIGGFIVTGTQPKRVIVRAIGPSLSSFFPGALADPILELRDSSGALIGSNDNWRSDQEAEIIATTVAPSDDLESAIVAILPANGSNYTAIVRGANNGTGIGVVEAYDLDRTVNSKLANISTRGLVQTGDNVMIGGMIVLGQTPLRVIVRAIGPSLPVSGALADPTLELRDGNGVLLAANDNWRSDQEEEIIATTIPPSDNLESAIVRNLAPGNYTAIVRGANDTTGIAVVEAYALN
jgi:uncharacterized delta-60 repeat protein